VSRWADSAAEPSSRISPSTAIVRRGKPLLSPRPLGAGLAGALLAELMLAGCIGLRSDTAVMIAYYAPAAAVHGHVLQTLIASEPGPLPVTA
jgi:Golgi phosphoprotein 3 (GPP34)